MSIEYQNVNKTFLNPNKEVAFSIEAFSLFIERGQAICFIGPSGCGKSTVLKMLNRLIEPDSGQIMLNGQPIISMNPYALRKKIGYVTQAGGLFPNLNIAENINLIAKLEGYSASDTLTLTKDLLDLVNLPYSEFAHRYPFELSGGQCQRVGVARALALNPDYIIMDEPFGALDPLTRHDIQKEFINLRKKLNKTFIIVTHDLNEAFRLGDKTAILNQGKLVQIDTEEGLKQRPANAFVEDFILAYED